MIQVKYDNLGQTANSVVHLLSYIGQTTNQESVNIDKINEYIENMKLKDEYRVSLLSGERPILYVEKLKKEGE